MQTVLVAGGAGFIGTHLCQSLLNDGYKVICVDNFLTSSKENIKPLLKNPNFVFINQDVTLPLETNENVDFVFHLASPASPNKKSPRSYMNLPIETLLVNSIGTKNLLDFSKEKNARFLYTSTSEVYGDPAVSPQPESYFGNVNPNGVRSVYDEGKRFGEAMVMAYFRKYDLDIRIIRIFNTYGPLMQVSDGRVVSDFINQALKGQPITVFGSGTQTRSFCFVDDMVKGLKMAMFSKDSKGEVINLGGSNELSVIDIANSIKKMTNSSSEIIFEDLPLDDPKLRKPDISKAKKLLNWEPRISLEDGLLKTIEYFKSL
jgi:nucleoside-diphosphate-sugar epimerase